MINTEMNNSEWWVVSDLDGTMMDHTYDISNVVETVNWLKEKDIPLIPCTSKTASEVRLFRKELDINYPYIVENGSAIYGQDKMTTSEWKLILGRSYEELRPILDLISKCINYQLRAFNDLTLLEVEELTGLKGKAIDRALSREWSVPFLNPPINYFTRIMDNAKKYDVNIFKGNLMCHLLCRCSHKGNAVLELKKYFKNNDVKVLALGDSQNDLPLLEMADLAVVIPSERGPNKYLLEGINKGEFILAPSANGKGWSEVVRRLITTK